MKRSRHLPRRRASALTFSLIMAVFLAGIAGVILTLSVQEHRLTSRRIVVVDATNAAESTINHGISQIVNLTKASYGVSEDLLKSHPLAIPTAGEYGQGGFSVVNPANVTLLGGRALIWSNSVQIPTGLPTSVTDESKGLWVRMETFPLLASVTISEPRGAVRVYAKAHLVMRDSPLFNYAVFYNKIPLEVAPGSSMVIGGSVRTNDNIYLSGGGGQIRITGTVNSAGSIYGGRDSANSGMSGSASTVFVGFKDFNNNGYFDDITNDRGWSYDGTNAADPFFSSDKNAEMISMTIKNANGSTGFLDARNSDWKNLATTVTSGNVQDASHGVSETMPPGITASQGDTIIQPPLAKGSTGYDENAEKTKYANKAGLYLVVEADGTVSAFQRSADALTYKSSGAASGAARTAWKAANPDKVVTLPSGVVATGSFMDRREGKAVTSVDLDLGNLRTAIAGTSTPLTLANGSSYALDTPDSAGWNGVVYVDVENPNAGWQNFQKTDSKGNVTSTTVSTRTAVRITDAQQVPDRAATNAAGSRGFTLATNAPLYTLGHVNADGKSGTGSNSSPDSGSPDLGKLGTETPVSLVADAITLLSSNWKDANSYATDSANAPDFTEISAALMVGIVKSANKAYSGGLENFPRLLEPWGGKTLRIRGSMVGMYESRYATGKWNGSVYGVPGLRDWGYSKIFGNGIYPPGTPVLRSYRRVNFRLLSAAEYEAERKSGTWLKADGSTTPKFPW